MKSGSGPSSVMKEHFVSSPHGLDGLHVANEVLRAHSLPEDWKVSMLKQIYSGSVDANCYYVMQTRRKIST